MHPMNQIRSASQGVAMAAFCLVSSAVVEADVITFAGAHGDVFFSDLNQDGTPDAGFEGGGLLPGVAVTVENFNRSFNLGVIFDTTFTGNTTDPDLLGPTWSGGGNLAAGAPVIGGIAIIQENTTGFDPSSNSMVSDPDDEGGRPAGRFTFTFDAPITSFGFDIIDVEGRIEAFSTLHFTGSGGSSTTLPFSSFMSRDPSVSFGNNSLNRINPITSAELGTGPWDSVTLQLGGSGGLDNVQFTTVPEPSILLLLGTGLGLAYRGRRRYFRRNAAAVTQSAGDDAPPSRQGVTTDSSHSPGGAR